MGKLLKILGQEAYDQLKVTLGDAFAEFEKAFEVDTVIVDTEGEYMLKSEVGTQEIPKPMAEEGWVSATGEIDMTKVTDPTLKGVLEKFQSDLVSKDAELVKAKVETALENEATKRGIISPSDVYKFVDMSKLVIGEDGKVTGINEALDELAQSKPYLFKQVENDGEGFNPPTPNQNKVYRSGMSLAEAREIK